jgi:HAD superfamily hydrolase (TIGR01509 family)
MDLVHALIYDFDGTLFHLPVDYPAVRRELGLPAEAKIGPLLQRWLDEDDQARLAVYTRHERAAVPAGELLPGARECLSAPGNKAILTRNSRLAVLDALGELAGGVLVVGREDVRRLKPDPEGVRRVLAHFGVGAEQAALIGDTYHDVQAARAAGVYSVIVRNPRLAYAPEGADRYLDALHPNPTFADNPTGVPDVPHRGEPSALPAAGRREGT